jgi:membrane protease YdiL (CAAX protease family)
MQQDFFSQFPWPSAASYQAKIDKAKEKAQISRVSLGFLIVLLLPTLLLDGAAIVSMILARFFPIMDNWTASLFWTNVLNYFFLYAISLPLFYLVIRKVPIEAPDAQKIRFSQWLLYFVIAMGFMIIGSVIGNAFMVLPRLLFENENPLQGFTSEVPIWFSALLMGVAAPFGEELIFRKWTIDRLSRYGTLTSILISAFFFGVFHQNFYQFFYAFLVGLLLGYLYNKTGKYLYCAFLHMGINLVFGVLPTVLRYFAKIPADPNAQWIPETFLQTQSYFALLFLVFLQYASAIACVTLLLIFWKRWIVLKKGTCQIPKQDWVSVVLGNGGMIAALVVAFLLLSHSILS